jgi:RNA polymerase sigma-70 factor (ECF subfamily)
MDLDREKCLVLRAKTDAGAFGELYDEYYGKIYSYILKRTANVAIAQDITSEVFLKALDNIKRFEWRGIHFSAWLYRIADNEINNSYMHNSRLIRLKEELEETARLLNISLEQEIEQAESHLSKQSQFLALHKCITQLPVKYQEVLTLKYFEKKKIREISLILGKSEGTVKSLLHRGVKKLKTLIENATF